MSGISSFDTRAAIAAATITSDIVCVTSAGYSVVGDDGGARYERVTSQPTHSGKVQSADGAWWEIAEVELRPEQFGAVANGTTDDYTAINNCAQTALAKLVPVRLSAKTYVCGTVVIVNAPSGTPFSVHGEYGKTKVLLTNYNSGFYIKGPSITDRCYGVTLTGFTIGRDNASTFTGTLGPRAITIENANNVRVKYVEEYGGIGFGMLLNYCNDYRLEDCTAHDHKGGATQLSGTDGLHFYHCTNGVVTNNYVYNVGDDAISFGSFDGTYSTNDFICSSNIINNTAGSIKVYGNVYNFNIFGNKCLSMLNGGVTIWDDRDTGQSFDIYNGQISENLIIGCGGAGASGGVYLVQPSGTGTQEFRDITISNNTIISCAYGVSVISTAANKTNRRITVTGNTLRNITSRGIYFDKYYEMITIRGNVVNGSGLEGVLAQNASADCHTICENNISIGSSATSPATVRGIWLRSGGLGQRYTVTENQVLDQVQTGTRIAGIVIASGIIHPNSFINDNYVDSSSAALSLPYGNTKNFKNSAMPSGGTWSSIGDTVWNSAYVSGGPIGWLVTRVGTYGSLSGVTASTTSGSQTAVLSDTSLITEGMYILIAGVTNVRRVIKKVGTTLTLDTAADVTVSAGAVSFQIPKFTAILGSATKGVTASRPTLDTSAGGQQYLDTTLSANGKPIWWTGTTWVDSSGVAV